MPPAATASTTGAEMQSASTAAEPTSPAAAADTANVGETPAGQLICRVKTTSDGTSELYLTWDGATATGVLRRSVPSGMVYVQRVQAERAGAMIVADVPGESDLVSHAATVRTENGKQYLRLGEGSRAWSACE